MAGPVVAEYFCPGTVYSVKWIINFKIKIVKKTETAQYVKIVSCTVCFIIIYNYYTQCNLITQVDIHSFKFYFGSMAPY